MKLIILGMGCPRCKTLAANTEEAARKLGLSYELSEITDQDKIASYGVSSLPALVADGHVLSEGKVLTVEEVEPLLRDAQSKPAAVQEQGTGKVKRVMAFVVLVILVIIALIVGMRDNKANKEAVEGTPVEETAPAAAQPPVVKSVSE